MSLNRRRRIDEGGGQLLGPDDGLGVVRVTVVEGSNVAERLANNAFNNDAEERRLVVKMGNLTTDNLRMSRLGEPSQLGNSLAAQSPSRSTSRV